MTAQNRINLKADFEDGDTLTGSKFANLIDSTPNLVDTTAQSFASNISVPGIVCNLVSADTLYVNNAYFTLSIHNNPCGQLYQDLTAYVSADTNSQYYVIGVPTSGVNLTNFTQVSGVLTYAGVLTATFAVQGSFSVIGNYSSEQNIAAIFKNGNELVQSRVAFGTNNTNNTPIHVQSLVQLAPSDTVDVRLKILTTASANYQVQQYNLVSYIANWS
jgi:hypothetical protein